MKTGKKERKKETKTGRKRNKRKRIERCTHKVIAFLNGKHGCLVLLVLGFSSRIQLLVKIKFFLSDPPASEASREVANLTEGKNPYTPVYGVKEFVCLSVCLSVCLWSYFSGRAWTLKMVIL